MNLAKYVCTMCGFSYREDKGRPSEGIAEGTVWDDVPDDWKCPMCGSPRNIFRLYRDEYFE
ncbi:rubredoxin [Methanomethylophilus alvi]|uniref:rubredoxin n=1 Tax=Methanomethylophilus alvi TaxID=1291540 RepID=UPI002A53E0F0|nr:rubredoxin [Methanomethylophilus alvi]MDD7479827.1 rubredoxin [Methanomethylophilus alvi]MDY7061169.1 rubredoxin [Methanomethylophilus alvi]